MERPSQHLPMTTEGKTHEGGLDVFDRLAEYESLSAKKKSELVKEFPVVTDNPVEFFNQTYLDTLSKITSPERVFLLSVAAGYLQVTPSLANSFCTRFPEDTELIQHIFMRDKGFPETIRDHMLFSLTYNNFILKDLSKSRIEKYRLDDYAAMNQRRERAVALLIGDRLNGRGSFEKFGQAANGLIQAMQEAERLQQNGEQRIDLRNVFNKHFISLAPEQQADLLRTAIAEMHNSLVFHETFNSAFTAERVEQDRQRTLKQPLGHHNPAHSMLFKTYQPLAVYGESDAYFDYEMDSTVEIGGYVEEYPYHRLLRYVIEKLQEVKSGQKQNCETLVEFWNKNRNPIFGNAVADALSAQDPEYAASLLMPLLQAEPRDKQVFSSILYRLELGKIGVSTEGVRYLGKLYDIGEANKQAAFAHRLTADGKVGLFDDTGKALKYFHLTELDEPEKVTKAELLEFTLDTLFYPKPDETDEERAERESILEEFKANYFKTYLSGEFYNQTKVMFNNLSLREQGWFLWYVQHASDADKKRAMAFIKQYREDGFKTFLSLEQDRKMGEAILTLGDEIPTEDAEMLFAQYAELVEKTTVVADVIARQFKAKPNDEVVQRVAQHLLERAKNILASASKNKNKKDATTLTRALRQTQNDLLLYAATFKGVSETEPLDIESVENTAIAEMKTGEIDETDKTEMRAIFLQNRDGYPPELLEQTKKDFEEILSDAKKKFYILKVDRSVVAFMRFDPLGPGRLYGGSLNVRPEMRGSAIGSAFFRAALDRAAQTHVVEADVYEQNPMLKHYIEDFGFQVVGEDPNYHGTGQRFIKIERPAVQSHPGRAAA